MAWSPIAFTVPQYVNSSGVPYSGAVLKAYASGTSTPISMATDSSGGTTASSITLNASGYPSVSGNVVIPHVAQTYKLALYPTQAAADANSGAIWTIDSLSALAAALAASSGSSLIGFSHTPAAPAGTVGAKLQQYVSVKDAPFNAAGDGVTDDRAAIQAAWDYCIENNLECYMPGGDYLINSVGPTYGGKVYGLHIINGIVGQPNYYKPLKIRGAGMWVTKIVCNDATLAIDRLIGLQCNGEGSYISDVGISAPNTGSYFDAALYLGAASWGDRIWIGGGKKGFYLSGTIALNNIKSEFAGSTSLFIEDCFRTTVNNAVLSSATSYGIYVYTTTVASGSSDYKSLPGVELNNIVVVPTAAGGVGIRVQQEIGTYSPVSVSNSTFGNMGFAIGAAPEESYILDYAFLINGTDGVSFTNCNFVFPKYGSTIDNARSVKITSCHFVKSGFVKASATGTNWATRDIAITDDSNVSVIASTFDHSSGNSVYLRGDSNLTLIGNDFLETSTGGLDTSGVAVNTANATVGDSAVFFRPASSANVLKMIGNHFASTAAYNTGKYGLKIDMTDAVPAEKNVQLTNNTIKTSSFATRSLFSGGAYTVTDRSKWSVSEDQLVDSTWITPPFSAGDFTGSGSMTWTVGSGDVTSLKYLLKDKLMTVSFVISTTDTGGVADAFLQIAIPAGKVATNQVETGGRALDKNTHTPAYVSVAAGGSVIRIRRQDLVNWQLTGGTADTYVYGTITFEVN